MENNFEEKRSNAHGVALVDRCCIIVQILIIIGGFILGLNLLIERGGMVERNELLNGKLEYVILIAVILVVFVAVDCYAINRLLVASSKDIEWSTEKALFWTRVWFYFNILFLLVTMVSLHFLFALIYLIELIYCVLIRFLMLRTISEYINALKERLMQNRTENEVSIV